MPQPTIIDGSKHFFPITYEGNGGGQKVGKFVPFTDNGTIAKSVIFNDDDNPYLSRTNDAGDRDTFTVSVWVKRSITGNIQHIFDTYDGSSDNDGYIRFNADSTISTRIGTPSSHLYTTNRTFEDTTKWYHIVLSVNTNESTADDRVKLYVDGDLITSYSSRTNPSGGDNTQFNYSSATFRVGSTTNGNYDYDGYIAEFNLVDGSALTPSTFGLTDTSTGRWIPKALTGITYGTNGHRLEFANSAGQTIGDDTSGNTNDFTVSGLATTDIVTDSPTQNHATFDPNFSSSSVILSEGNLTVKDNASNNYENFVVGMPVQNGKWYFEITVDNNPNFYFIGVNNVSSISANKNQYPGYADGSASFLFHTTSDSIYYGGANYINAGSATTLSNGDKVGVAYDADTGAFWVAKNNSWLYSGNPSTGANPLFSGITSKQLVYFSVSSWAQNVQTSFNFGQKSFSYTAPTGFKAVQQDNLSTTDKGIPDLVWIKNRDATDPHQLYDSSRGPLIDQQTNTNATDSTTTDGLQKFLKGGFAIEDDVSINTSGESYVSWNWVANGGTTSANTDGSGATLASTIQANQTAGFSIVSYTGNATAGAKVAHGLSQAPEWLWIHCRSLATGGKIYHHKNTANPETDYLALNTTDATYDAAYLNDTAPDAKCFTLGGTGLGSNNDSATYMAYCWHGVEGFSKFGKFKGNASTSGPYVYLGFKPAWVMFKNTNASTNWVVWDNARTPFNPIGTGLLPNDTHADTTGFDIDFNASGFRLRDSESTMSGNTNTIVYFAFAEHPFIGNGTNPVTAF